MPIDYSRYPDDWLTRIRPDILERDQHRCKFCGVSNYETIWRHNDDPAHYVYIDDSLAMVTDDGEIVGNYELMDYGDKPVKIVLTIAHLDHDISNNDYDNLAALCQRCHNTYDAPNRLINRSRTMIQKHIQQTGQLELWGDDHHDHRD